MKRLFFTCFVATCFIASCKKDLNDAPVKENGSQNVSAELVYWDDLPDEYKNAIRVSPDNAISKKTGEEVLPKDPYKQDQILNPFNITSENFSITIPRNHIKKIAIGRDKSGRITHITFWYTTSQFQSILYSVSSGGNTNTPMVTYTVSDGEYVRGFSGRSANGILKDLTIYTNKGSVSTGSGSTGSYFSFFVTPGSFIGKFSGNVGSFVAQLKATSYFIPWQQVSANNARDIAIDTSGTAYITDAAGRLYQMPKTSTSWSLVTGAPSNVQKVAANIEILYVTTSTGRIYRRMYNQWSELPGSYARDIAVNAQGTPFMINTAGNLHTLTAGNAWIQRSSNVNLQRVAVGNQANARLIGAGGYIYAFGGTSSTGLSAMPGSEGRDIAIALDNQIWITTLSGKIKCLQLPGSSWKEIAGSDAVRIDAIPGRLMIVNTSGEVYKLEY